MKEVDCIEDELEVGDIFCIKGFRVNFKGEHDLNCKPGRESEFIVYLDIDGLKKFKLKPKGKPK